jgi:hypothetical protein
MQIIDPELNGESILPDHPAMSSATVYELQDVGIKGTGPHGPFIVSPLPSNRNHQATV